MKLVAAIKKLEKMKADLPAEIERVKSKLAELDGGRKYYGRVTSATKMNKLMERPEVDNPSPEFDSLYKEVGELASELFQLDQREQMFKILPHGDPGNIMEKMAGLKI